MGAKSPNPHHFCQDNRNILNLNVEREVSSIKDNELVVLC